MIIITFRKIFKKIDDDNNYIKKYLKGSVGIPRSKIFKMLSSLNV